MWLEMAKWAGIMSVPLFAFITICYAMAGQWGNATVNFGITILYFGLFILIIALKIY